MQETTRKVALHNRVGMFQETIGTIRIAQIGRHNNHILNLLRIFAQNSRRRNTCCYALANLDGRVVDLGQFVREELLQLSGLGRILLAPSLNHSLMLRSPRAQLLATLCIQLLSLREHLERILGIATQALDRCCNIDTSLTKRLTVSRNQILAARSISTDCALAHHGLTNDQRRTLLLVVSRLQCLTNLIFRVAVDAYHSPAPSLVLSYNILSINLLNRCRELNIVGIVVHNQIVQTEVAGQTTDTLRNLLLNTTVRDVGVGLVSSPLAKACCNESLSNSRSNSHRVALTQRTRRVLDTACHIQLRVAGGYATPLTELTQLVHREMTCQCQHTVQHRRHMTRIQEETIAERISRIVGIVTQKLRIEHIDEIGTTHCTTRVSRFGFFDHCGSQYSYVIGCCLHLISSH